MELITFSLLNGVVYGFLLFMLSSGLTLIFGMMGVLNLAHASFFMLGAYFAYQISETFGFWPGLVIAPVIVGVLGALIERYGLRVVHRAGHAAELLFTLGLMFLIDELVPMIWGRMPVSYRVPAVLDFTLFILWDTSYPAYRVFMIFISVSMLLTLYLFLTRSRIGLLIQASLTHPEMVGMLGHNVPRIFMLTFGVGCALAGLAGVIGGNALTTEPSMAATLGPIVFVVVVVGGMGSLIGAFIASFLVGLIQAFAIALHYSVGDFFSLFGIEFSRTSVLWDLWSMSTSQVGPALPYLLLVLVLIFRPTGLMGVRES
ncbi:MAG: branched-chain amino acid ABC transporter permease [Deltaproteobacteria bacterium]|nr:branched-chain amino acid ABC transporter permease [Deltaproteobacteria bacterium]